MSSSLPETTLPARLESDVRVIQIGCYVLMSAFKLVLDIGLQAIPGAGKILDAGLGKFFLTPAHFVRLHPNL